MRFNSKLNFISQYSNIIVRWQDFYSTRVNSSRSIQANVRGIQKVVFGCFDGIGMAQAKWIFDIRKIVTEFMFA